MNTKIKIFPRAFWFVLEKEVNTFLDELSKRNCEVVDVKCFGERQEEIMVIYHENKEEL